MINDEFLTLGSFVYHTGCRDWGLGQIQSVVGRNVTVNFEHRGKVVINTAVVLLESVDLDRIER